MLYLVGLGLSEGDLSLKGLEALKAADRVFAEFYTAPNVFDLEKLEQRIGNSIKVLDRQELEENFFEITKGQESVALLVPGDPLSATTHFEIYRQAEKRGEQVRIIHAPSVLSAVAETGLNLYKFGRITTLPQPTEDYLPTSPYEIALKNFNNNMHSLILLDKEMSADQALQMLKELEEMCGDELFIGDRQLLVAERLGSPDRTINRGTLEQLTGRSYGTKPHSLILPADLAHKERQYLYLKKGN